jgi:hypothetical protein
MRARPPYAPGPDGELLDVTEVEPTIAGPAGQIVSTPLDLRRFWQALFDGALVGPTSAVVTGSVCARGQQLSHP